MIKYAALCVLLLIGCSKAQPITSPLIRAPAMDLARMSGDWEVVAHIPTYFDRSSTDMRVHIDVQDDQTMAIDWSFKKSAEEASDTHWHLTGYPGARSETTLWILSPFWPVKLKFQVTEFSGDYSWVIFAAPDRRYLWVLSREHKMEASLLKELMARLKNMDFDVDEVVQSM